MYSKTNKVVHNTKPWNSINNRSKVENKKQNVKSNLTNNLSTIENEYNMLNSLYQTFFEKISNHSIFIKERNCLIVVKDFEIYNIHKMFNN